MERKLVESSNLESIGYDKEKQWLEVQFKNGTMYRYFDVPEIVFFELGKAESVGKYFHANVKNKYNFEKVE